MTKKFKIILTLFLVSLLIISNMVGKSESLAMENNTVIKKESSNYKVEKVTGLGVKDESSTCIVLEWNKVKGATGYNIYRTTLKNGIHIKVGYVDENKTIYVDKDLDSSKNYYYKVKAYRKVGNKKYYGCPSDILYATTSPKKVMILHADCISNCSIEISWPSVPGASGYEVYRSNTLNGKYIRVATRLDARDNFYRDTNLRSRKKYYYKVRAFKELNGQITFGKCSEVLETFTK